MDQESMKKMLCNPFYCLNIADGLFGDHEPMISKEEWKKIQINLITDIGLEEYFDNLISVLEGNYPTSEDL